MNKKEIEKISNYIFIDNKPEKANLAFVFGTRKYQKAINTVYKLYLKGLVKTIIVSGGINRVIKKNEANQMSQQLIRLGANASDILIENKSTNTLENVLFSKQIISEKIGFNNIQKIIAITKHYHARRALMTIKKHFPKHVKLLVVTYGAYEFDVSNWFKSDIGREKVLGEYKKIIKYLKKGDIREL